MFRIRLYRSPEGDGGNGNPPPAGGAPAAVTFETLNGLQGDAFRNILPEEFRGKGYMKDVNTFGDFVKKFDGAQSLIGSRGVPAENASPEEWNKWFASAGRPEKPEAYLTPVIEGVPQEFVDQAMNAGSIKALMHQSGMNQVQAKAFLSGFLKHVYAGEQAEKAAEEKAYATLMDSTFGNDRQAIVENGKKYLAAVLPANVVPLLEKLPPEALGVVLAATDSVVRKFGQEDAFRGGKGGGSGTPPENMETLTAQMKGIMSQKEYQDPFINKQKHAELNAQMDIIRAKMRKLS